MICGWARRRGERTMRAPSTRCSNHMAASVLRAAFLLVVLVAGGCSRNSDLWPILTGETRSSTPPRPDAAPAAPAARAPVQSAAVSPNPPPTTAPLSSAPPPPHLPPPTPPPL